jgi:hypothetical protein
MKPRVAGDHGWERIRNALHKHNSNGGDGLTHITDCHYLKPVIPALRDAPVRVTQGYWWG